MGPDMGLWWGCWSSRLLRGRGQDPSLCTKACFLLPRVNHSQSCPSRASTLMGVSHLFIGMQALSTHTHPSESGPGASSRVAPECGCEAPAQAARMATLQLEALHSQPLSGAWHALPHSAPPPHGHLNYASSFDPGEPAVAYPAVGVNPTGRAEKRSVWSTLKEPCVAGPDSWLLPACPLCNSVDRQEVAVEAAQKRGSRLGSSSCSTKATAGPPWRRPVPAWPVTKASEGPGPYGGWVAGGKPCQGRTGMAAPRPVARLGGGMHTQPFTAPPPVSPSAEPVSVLQQHSRSC